VVINTRRQIVKWAIDGVRTRGDFTYEEIRPLELTWPPIHTVSDCSWYVKLCFWKAGAPDPMGLNFDGYGNSVTLFQRGTHISLAKIKPGDVIVFGPGGDVHAVVVVQRNGADPVCASMGKPGDPSLVPLSELLFLGPATYLRFRTLNRRLIPSRKQH
jgi:hypothetical protein